MPRVKRGTKRRAKRKKILDRASGYFLTKSKLYRAAKEAVERGLKFAYSGRKQRKRQFRSLWIVRIAAACKLNGTSYSRFISGLKKAGVAAYLVKNEAPRMLVTAIERVLAGELFFASGSASRSVKEIEAPEYVPAPFLLTHRELEVMRLLAQGRSNKELAATRDMSVRTAESHHASILAKLGIDSPGELVRIAIRDGLI